MLRLVCLNPLNQVYVFNAESERRRLDKRYRNCLNPLNQVYVFNAVAGKLNILAYGGLNPLNQVYVFNGTSLMNKKEHEAYVLIP